MVFDYRDCHDCIYYGTGDNHMKFRSRKVNTHYISFIPAEDCRHICELVEFLYTKMKAYCPTWLSTIFGFIGTLLKRLLKESLILQIE